MGKRRATQEQLDWCEQLREVLSKHIQQQLQVCCAAVHVLHELVSHITITDSALGLLVEALSAVVSLSSS